jgi:hypothetical protein
MILHGADTRFSMTNNHVPSPIAGRSQRGVRHAH